MTRASRGELLRIAALLEERHGVGVRADDLPSWLEARLQSAVSAALATRALSWDALPAALEQDTELVRELASALRVGETRFYRDAPQWEALRLHVIPELLACRDETQPLMALSAGCSTGEEAWTLAMLLAEGLSKLERGARRRVRVMGVDRSEPALVTASAGLYDADSGRALPRELGQRYLQRRVDGSAMVCAELMAFTSFQARDLLRGPPPGRYALIVCKNVLIYFGDEAQRALVAELLRSLTADGVLLVARSEVPILRALGAQAVEIAPSVTAFRA